MKSLGLISWVSLYNYMKYARLGVLFLVEPRGVHLVIVGNALVKLTPLLGGDLLDELSRNASPQGVRLDDGLGQDDRACSYDSPFADDDIIHHDGSHADEGVVTDMAAVECDIVPDRDIVTDLNGRLLIEGMEDGAVLDIHVVADADGIDVTAEDGVEPDAAALSKDDISDDGSVDSEEAVLTDLRRDASYSLYECHDAYYYCLATQR